MTLQIKLERINPSLYTIVVSPRSRRIRILRSLIIRRIIRIRIKTRKRKSLENIRSRNLNTINTIRIPKLSIRKRSTLLLIRNLRQLIKSNQAESIFPTSNNLRRKKSSLIRLSLRRREARQL